MAKKYSSNQSNGFSILGIQVHSSCHANIKKNLANRVFLFNSWYRDDKETLVQLKNTELIRTLYGQNISVQAIVGKNGSGKSSIMELIYRIINNISFMLVKGMDRPAAQPMYYIEGVYATLWFESGSKCGTITCEGAKIIFQWGDDNPILMKASQYKLDSKYREYISRHFCYTLVCNFAMMGLVSSDFNRDVCFPKAPNGAWIESIYKKNDGYQAAIGFEPYKGDEKIDINRQKQLNTERLSVMLIDSKRYHKPFFENYYLHNINLSFKKGYVNKKYNTDIEEENQWHRHPEYEIAYLWRKRKSFAYHILRNYGFDYFNLRDSIVKTAMAYIVYKTLSIGETYPQYQKFRIVSCIDYYSKQTSKFNERYINKLVEDGKDYDISGFCGVEQMLHDLCCAIEENFTHSELKFRQALNFLNAVKKMYHIHGADWCCPDICTYSQYMQIMFPTYNPKSPQDILEHYPPQFFEDTISLKKDTYEEPIPFYSLSSGEKQFMQTLGTIVYHIRNIISINDSKGLAKYNNINLMFDEVETCFHPEFQQKFIKSLIDILNNVGITNQVNVNIILATHSPFILSDIPDSNILFLEDGNIPDKSIKGTFCGNVCDMLEQGFFLKNGFMGYYAKEIVNDLLLYLMPNKKNNNYTPKYQWNIETSKVLISIIGEPMLKNSLMNLWYNRFGQDLNELVEWHKKEIERLISTHNK